MVSSVQFSHSVVSDSVIPCTAAHRSLCPLPTPRACSNSCPLSRWCHPNISTSVIPYLLASNFPSIRVFSNESVLHIRWPKYWSLSFSIGRSNEYSELTSFRMDWLDLLAVQGTQESSQTPQFKTINSLVLTFLYGPFLHPYMTSGKKHSFNSMDLCQQSKAMTSLDSILKRRIQHKSQQDPLWLTSHNIRNKSKNKQMGPNET